MDVQEHIQKVFPQLHAIPEPAWKEVRTAAFLAGFLRELGYSVEENAGGTTAVLAELRGPRPGATVAVRTDMDALLFREADGSMRAVHACGHDGHMTIALGVAKIFAERGVPCGKLKIICQPAEEIGQGALALVDAGALDDVDYLLGYHLLPRDRARAGQIVAQINWTACTLMEAEVRGRAAHGSAPHLGISAIDAGAGIVAAINALRTDPLLCGNVKTTRFASGSGSLNAICDRVELGFDLRSNSNSEMLALRERVADVVRRTAAVYGASAECRIAGTCPAAEADPSLLQAASAAITEELGGEALLPALSITVGEDFNFYKQRIPRLKTASLGIGCDLVPTLHDPQMTFKTEALADAIRVIARLAEKILRGA